MLLKKKRKYITGTDIHVYIHAMEYCLVLNKMLKMFETLHHAKCNSLITKNTHILYSYILGK